MTPITVSNQSNPYSSLTVAARDDGEPGVQLTHLSGERVSGQVVTVSPAQWADIVAAAS